MPIVYTLAYHSKFRPLAGIYIHIPFCKQACYYCDFHFSTNVNTKTELIDAILTEIVLQKDYLNQESIETIYFGGGTPTLLSHGELDQILTKIRSIFSVEEHVEVTIEANPDDLSINYLKEIKSIGINRLSIGIQSFNDRLLQFFNRAHDSNSAQQAVLLAHEAGFDNISIDLIFGVPDQSLEDLKNDLQYALELNTPHLSIYGLTIEEGTVFAKWEKSKKLKPLEEELAAKHLEYIINTMSDHGYIQYEICNFSKPGAHSRHNSSYWHSKKYLGLGPAAHSFNQSHRQYNVSHNKKYIDAIKMGIVPFEAETLTQKDRINEMIMMQIRLIEGVSLINLVAKFEFDLVKEKRSNIEQLIHQKMIVIDDQHLLLTEKGKLLADFITENLII